MNLLHSLAIIFTIISIGIFCGKKKLFSETHLEGFELFLFKVALPCYLFSAILNNDFQNLVNIPYVLCYLSCFLTVALIITLCFFRHHNPASICLKILAASYVNTAIYALPMMIFLLDDPKAAVLSNLVQVIIIQSSFLTVLSLLNHREQSLSKRLLKPLLTPLIVLPIIGMILCYCHITPHFIITTITQNLGDGVSSIALFIFGLTLSHIRFTKEDLNKTLCFLLFTKNILHPAIAFGFGKYLFHLDKYWLYAMVIAASSPTAFIVYIIAKQFSTNIRLTKMMVFMSSTIALIFLVCIAHLMNTAH
jgi:malonate transporter